MKAKNSLGILIISTYLSFVFTCDRSDGGDKSKHYTGFFKFKEGGGEGSVEKILIEVS